MATAEKPVLARYRDRMDKAVAALKEEFGSLRTGRASASLLDQVHVEAYGATTALSMRSLYFAITGRSAAIFVSPLVRALSSVRGLRQ